MIRVAVKRYTDRLAFGAYQAKAMCRFLIDWRIGGLAGTLNGERRAIETRSRTIGEDAF